MALRSQECKAHAAADDQLIDFLEQRIDHTQLVADL